MPYDPPTTTSLIRLAIAQWSRRFLRRTLLAGIVRAAVLARWVRDIAISLAVSAFFILFLYQPVKVEGTSMMPTLDDQERVFINKFVYRLEPIQRGDVVVFRYPRDTSKSYIKRVIARAR